MAIHLFSKRFLAACAMALGAALTGGLFGAQTVHGEDWFPSRYGAADTLGAINELSPDKVVNAAKLVTTGKTYSLGIETGVDTPAVPPRGYKIAIFDHVGPEGAGTNKITGNDDLIMSYLGVGSQIDGLGHVGIDFMHYNGTPAADFVKPDGVTKFGTHLLPPVVGRGVLLDVAAHRGVARVPKGSAVNRAEIQAITSKHGLTLGAGDIVLLHTGWGGLASEDAAEFMSGEPGLGLDGAEYLSSLRVTAVGADVWGLEVIPFETEGVLYPVHQHFLAKHGIYILENMNTAELAADGVTEFFFVLGQPKFVGAVQVVINPVGIR